MKKSKNGPISGAENRRKIKFSFSKKLLSPFFISSPLSHMTFGYLCQKLPFGDSPSFRSNWSTTELPPKCSQANCPIACIGLRKNVGSKKSFPKSTKNKSALFKTSQQTVSDNFSMNKCHWGSFRESPNDF